MAIPQVRLATWRHDLHRIPETAFTEYATSDYLAAQLADLGLEVQRGIGGTGVVGTLRRGNSASAIALRADMDGLPLTERGQRPYQSQHEGQMHACGHDGHMAMVLGAAAQLAAAGQFDGTLHVIFQPAEEPGHGAQAMLDDGLLHKAPFREIYGLHNIPGITAGRIHVRPGPIMASEDNFTIVVAGVGGHASAPHLVVDPLVAGAQVVTALQTIVSRSVDPLAAVVVSCTEFTTDGARNAIPGLAVIKGDVRTFDSAASHLVEQRMSSICAGVAAATGAAIELTYTREFQPTVNDPACAAAVAAAASAVLGNDQVDADCPPITASEDFGVFARAVPGGFAFIGNGATGQEGGNPLHSRDYDFNDNVLPVGVAFYTRLVQDRLPA